MSYGGLMWDEVEAICRAPEFSRSPKLRSFLRHLADPRNRHDSGALGQYGLAIDLFERTEDFDPSQNSFVRVQANRLRAKLERHYRYFSPVNGYRICLPKGRYCLVLQREYGSSIDTRRRYKAITGKSRDSIEGDSFDIPKEDLLVEALVQVFSRTLFRVMQSEKSEVGPKCSERSDHRHATS